MSDICLNLPIRTLCLLRLSRLSCPALNTVINQFFGMAPSHSHSTVGDLRCTAPQVTAVDASEDAAAWAMFNVARCGLGNRVRVLVGSWYDPVADLNRGVAGIVSNPPYIRRDDLSGLQLEARPSQLCRPGPAAVKRSMEICSGSSALYFLVVQAMRRQGMPRVARGCHILMASQTKVASALRLRQPP